MLPMRILHVHTDLLGGGIEKSLVTLATHTKAEQVGICWCPTNHPPPPSEFLADLQQHLKLCPIPPPFLSPLYSVRLWQAIRAFRPTVLHLHGASIGIIGSIVGRLAKVPAIVYTEHSEHGRHAKWLQRARELTAALPHHTICVSNQIHRSLLDIRAFRRIAQRISVIHNGIDLSPYKARSADEKGTIRRELGLPEEARVIGSIGLLWYIKGYDYLVRAMPRVLSRIPQAELALVGSGEDETKLRQLAAELSITSKVHFLGWRNDVPRILPAFDVYVQPSLSEGLPMSILEAAATGLPIVATDVGGIPEIITNRENGLLIPPCDEAALAEAIIAVLTDVALMRNLGAQAQHSAISAHSAAAMADSYAHLYHCLLGL